METLTASCATILLALLPHEVVSSASPPVSPLGESSAARTPTGGLLSLPLIPHHALLERRRRELRSLGLSRVEAEAVLDDIRSATNAGDDDDYNGGPPREYLRNDGRHLAGGHAQQIGALYQGYGTHYVDVWVGTPPQRQTVIVDTGSGQTAFPCSGCVDCGESYHTDSYFIEADSSTLQKLKCSNCKSGSCKNRGRGEEYCRLSMHYSEGSKWDAYEAVDVAYAGGPHDAPLPKSDTDTNDDGADPNHARSFSFKLIFGCQTLITGLFRTQLADGIMGMCNRPSSFWSQMYRKAPDGGIGKQFSLCFTRQPTAERDGTRAGAVTLGGTDNRFHASPMVYAENTRQKSSWYTVDLKMLYIREGGGESAKIEADDTLRPLDMEHAGLNTGGVIVDSGTTDTYLTKTIGDAFHPLWLEVTGFEYKDRAWIKLTDTELRSLPTLLFQMRASTDGANDDMPETFDGTGLVGDYFADGDESSRTDVVVAMPASHYMMYDDEKDMYMGRIHFRESSDGCTLGANVMMGHDVLFDMENGRIGWAESDCNYYDVVGEDLDVVTEDEGPVEAEKKVAKVTTAEPTVDAEPTYEPTYEPTSEKDDTGKGADDGTRTTPLPTASTEEPTPAPTGESAEPTYEPTAEPSKETTGTGSSETSTTPPSPTVEEVQSAGGSSRPPYVGPGVATEDGVCSSNECRLEVVVIVVVAVIIFAVQRLRRRHRPEAVPTFDKDEYAFENEKQPTCRESSGGYSDNLTEVELSEHGIGTRSEEDDERQSEFSIT